jgi:hypothetical protein
MDITPSYACIFCTNKGIFPPHNHTIRDFSKKDKPIICPELLRSTCTYCKNLGHTKKYCPILKQKTAMISSKDILNPYKRGYISTDPDKCVNLSSSKIQKINLTSTVNDMDIVIDDN